MPSSIGRSTPVASSAVSQPRPLDVQVSENDPAMKAEVRNRLVTLRGTANNRGTVASVLDLRFDGKRVHVYLSRGDTAKKAMEKLCQALPPGYELRVPAFVGRTGNELASFEIHKAPVLKSNVSEINTQFAKALRPASESGAKVSVKELRAAVAVAEKGGLSAEDKDALARNWAALFNGAGYKATPAAQREFAKLQQRLDLPVYPVR